MRLSIAIVDDNFAFAEDLKRKLVELANKSGHEALVEYRDNPEEFLKEFSAKPDFDALFLDVAMPNLNGIDLAKGVRLINREIPIVFVSDFPQFSVVGYEVNAIRFLVKHSIDFETKLSECLEYTINILKLSSGLLYSINTTRLKTSIPYSDILYFEVANHLLAIHTFQGCVKERRLLSTLLSILPEHFVMCSRSYIVNLQHIILIHTKDVEFKNGKRLPLSRKYKDDVVRAFLALH